MKRGNDNKLLIARTAQSIGKGLFPESFALAVLRRPRP